LVIVIKLYVLSIKFVAN